jgi:hypothetical protein
MSRNAMIALVTIVVIVAVAAAIIGFRLSQTEATTPEQQTGGNTPSGETVCTMEAKMCPDGSYVGRTGPNCEFAACPNVGSSAQATLNHSVTISGVVLTPVEVVEDSRCPTDVQCIQAGTVRVRTRLGEDPNSPLYTFTLNTPQLIEGRTITLVEVAPAKVSTKTISSSDYRFGFTVK